MSNVLSRRIGRVSDVYFLLNTGRVFVLDKGIEAVDSVSPSGMVELTTMGGEVAFFE